MALLLQELKHLFILTFSVLNSSQRTNNIQQLSYDWLFLQIILYFQIAI